VKGLRTLKFRGVTLARSGFAGVKLSYMGSSICIDVPQPDGCTAALYTHNHPRHAPQIPPHVPVYSPFAGRRVAPGERLELVAGVKLLAVHAYSLGYGGAEAHPKGAGVGFLLEFPTRLRVYHAGDTDLVEEVLELRGLVDVAFLPVSGRGVMNPEEAAEAVKTIRPLIAIPIHEDSITQVQRFKRLAHHYSQVILLNHA